MRIQAVLLGPPLPLDARLYTSVLIGEIQHPKMKSMHLQKTPQEATFVTEAKVPRRGPVAIPGRQPTSRKSPPLDPTFAGETKNLNLSPVSKRRISSFTSSCPKYKISCLTVPTPYQSVSTFMAWTRMSNVEAVIPNTLNSNVEPSKLQCRLEA